MALLKAAEHVTAATANRESKFFPRVGELWGCEGRVSVVAGNYPEEDHRLWVMDWSTGERGDAHLSSLFVRQDRYSVNSEALITRFSEWARSGNADAMWFLGWWFEVVNHQRSVWYYIAALRADPDRHKWAYRRIVSDAHNPSTCTMELDGSTIRYPKPDLDFLQQIPEMHEAKLYCSKWREAVVQAEAAPHVDPVE